MKISLFPFFIFLLISYQNSAQNVFRHGVASGDPLSDKVIIWTKASNSTNEDKLIIKWQIASDSEMANILQSGESNALKKDNFCFKYDVTNLSPNTWYYYNFISNGDTSVTGRTKTTPVGISDSVRFAVVSCSNYEHGYFNAYQSIVNKNDVDAVIHLGDYIYEFESGHYSSDIEDRTTFPLHEIISLSDYRDRYAHYRLDTNLQNIHQNFPFINIWDDHEIANNAYKNGASNHNDSTEGDYGERLSFAKKAYYEWLPIREQKNEKLYRKINYGDNINLLFLDTRIEARDKQENRSKKKAKDSTRTLLGDEQFNWVIYNLSKDTSHWNILAQQVMIAPFKIAGVIANSDQWDGYSYEKDRLFDSINANHIKNIVVLTGDIHSAWANELPGDKYKARSGKNSLGVEFVAPSVTSARGIPIGKGIVKCFNKHVKFLELDKKGFFVLDINQKRVQADWFFEETILINDSKSHHGASFYVKKGETILNEVEIPSERLSNKNPPTLINNN